MGDRMTAKLADLIGEEIHRHGTWLNTYGSLGASWHCTCGVDGDAATRTQAIADGERHQAIQIAVTLRQTGIDLLPLAIDPPGPNRAPGTEEGA